MQNPQTHTKHVQSSHNKRIESTQCWKRQRESGQHWVELWHSHRIIHRIDNWTLGLFSLCFVFFVHNPRNNSSNRTYNIEIYLCLVLCRCLLCTFPHLLIFLRLSVSMWVHQSCIAFNANATHTHKHHSHIIGMVVIPLTLSIFQSLSLSLSSYPFLVKTNFRD